MGGFSQFGSNICKGGQTHFSQLHISLDPDELEKNIIFSSFTVVLIILQVYDMITEGAPKYM